MDNKFRKSRSKFPCKPTSPIQCNPTKRPHTRNGKNVLIFSQVNISIFDNKGKKDPEFINELKTIEMPPLSHLKEYYKDSMFEDLKDKPIPKGKPVVITIFADSSHANMKDNMQSVTGILIFFSDICCLLLLLSFADARAACVKGNLC